MGSWNGTCMLTNLAITYGERVALVPLVNSTGADEAFKSLNRGGFWYANDVFKPLTPAIIGEYDDYGGIENVKNGKLFYDFFVTAYGDELREAVNVGECDFPETFTDVIDAVERGCIDGLSFVMMHEGIYRTFIDEVGGRVPHNMRFTMREHVTQLAINFINLVKHGKTLDAYDNSFGRMLTGRSVYFFNKLVTTNDNVDLLNNLVDLYLMNMGLNIGRRAWMPTCGTGGQGDDLALSLTVANFVKSRWDGRVKRCLDEGDDPNDVVRDTMFVSKYGVR